jgi:putative nucleotidyltransferase with HDIG domain
LKQGRRIHAYVVSCGVAAAAIATLAIKQSPHFSWAETAGFGLLALVAAQFPLTLSGGALYDISFVIGIAALVAGGPGEATIAMAFATVVFREAFHRSAIRNLFNFFQLVLSIALGGIVYQHAGGLIGRGLVEQTSGGSLAGHVFLPLAAATATIFIVNSSLVSIALAVSGRRPFAQTWRETFGSLMGNFVAFAVLGLLTGLLKTLLDWASVLFILMPLLVARRVFQAAVTMQGAYDETVKGLVAAIEVKDPYTRGHAQRVAILAERTARAYGLSEERCRAIRYAALMHDVGKLGVYSGVLKKPGKLTPEEYDHMKVHPLRGVEIVQEIDLLQEAIDGVRSHHERMDGHGYPDGLVGDEIPLFARLIMVADAFDSMTSTRVYRVAKTIEEAFVELRRCAGTQFDEGCLDALEKAVAGHGWEPLGREQLEGPMEMGKEPAHGAQAASL